MINLEKRRNETRNEMNEHMHLVRKNFKWMFAVAFVFQVLLIMVLVLGVVWLAMHLAS